jgi:hypothetical protein
MVVEERFYCMKESLYSQTPQHLSRFLAGYVIIVVKAIDLIIF